MPNPPPQGGSYVFNKIYTYKKICTKSTNRISVISVSLIFHGVGQMSKFENTDRQTNGWTDRQTDEMTDRHIDGHMGEGLV